MEISKGNLLKAPVEALVNTVNTEGVMGKGIALQFKNAYPAMFKAYAERAKTGQVRLGKMDVHDLGGLIEGPRWIINFPTKGHWKSRSRIDDIQRGLGDLVAVIKRLGIKSIAIPPLGCGNGGLNWSDVRPVIESALAEIPDVKIQLFAPGDVPEAGDMPIRTEKPRLTLGQATLLVLMKRYLGGLLDPCVTLLEVHKLMYFMQEAGENLRLEFEAGHYGPYARNLRQLLVRMEGHYLRGFGEGSDEPGKVLEILDDAAAEAQRFLASNPGVAQRMKRVSELIDGFEDSYGMELLSTVHWVMCENPAARESLETAIAGVREWNYRKSRQMKPEHMAKAWSRLKQLHWDTEARSACRHSTRTP